MNEMPTKASLIRVLSVLAASFVLLWAVYRILLSISPEKGLTEFGLLALALLVNYWTGAFYHWIGKGKFFPIKSEAAIQEEQALDPGHYALSRSRAAAFLFIAWLAAWFYVTILGDALRSALFDSSKLGISLRENDALRILTELSGILSLGILFPLLAVSAFVVGLACISSLRVSALLIPSTAFCILTATLNYGREVLSTGRPPIYAAMLVVLRVPEVSVTSFDIGFMWLINILLICVGCWVFALYGRMWTALGFSLRQW